METIIQQIAKKLINKILEKAYSGGISDIDALSSAVLGDCKEAAVEMIEEITVQLNRQIRNDKKMCIRDRSCIAASRSDSLSRSRSA